MSGIVIQRSFDLLAPHYRWMECVLAGRKLQSCRTRFLDELASARNVLLLGEGNGRFLSELLQRNPAATITCVDASRGMQAAARRRLTKNRFDLSRVTFLHRDALDCDLHPNQYDAIATHFFLDCFTPEQLQQLTQRIARWATPDARWILSDFQRPDRGPKRWRAEAILALMYIFFRAATRLPARKLTEPRPYLERSGFRLARRAVTEWGLLYTELWRKCPDPTPAS
jgi:ubiquinone/menaquinone biosynthesis C-methylase UbiE